MKKRYITKPRKEIILFEYDGVSGKKLNKSIQLKISNKERKIIELEEFYCVQSIRINAKYEKVEHIVYCPLNKLYIGYEVGNKESEESYLAALENRDFELENEFEFKNKETTKVGYKYRKCGGWWSKKIEYVDLPNELWDMVKEYPFRSELKNVHRHKNDDKLHVVPLLEPHILKRFFCELKKTKVVFAHIFKKESLE